MKAFIGIIIGLFLTFTLIYGTAEAVGWTSADRFTQHIGAIRSSPAGLAGVALAVIALLTLDLILPVPSSVIMTLSGMFLGPVVGAAVSLAGAMASAWLGFGLCRRFGQRAFQRVAGNPDSIKVERFLERYGIWAIILSRSMPMLTEVMSCVAGLSTMSWGLFTVLTFAGTLPICGVYAWAGHQPGGGGWLGYAVLMAFVLPAVGLALVKLLQPHQALRD